MPSRPLVLRAGGAEARILPALGGRVTALRLASAAGAPVEVLVPCREDADPGSLLHWPKGGLYPLAPYGGRIRDAALRFHGRTHALQPHPAALPHALHGPAHRHPWQVTAETESTAEWTHVHAPDADWPFAYHATLAARLEPSAFHLRLTLRNDAPGPAPAGLGLHPYLSHHPADVVDFASQWDWPATPDLLAGPPVEQPAEPPGALPPGDVNWYRSGWNGQLRVLRADGVALSLTADPVFSHCVLHRPSSGAYLCFEPATHAPDGFNLAEAGCGLTGRVVLAPGEILSGAMLIRRDA